MKFWWHNNVSSHFQVEVNINLGNLPFCFFRHLYIYNYVSNRTEVPKRMHKNYTSEGGRKMKRKDLQDTRLTSKNIILPAQMGHEFSSDQRTYNWQSGHNNRLNSIPARLACHHPIATVLLSFTTKLWSWW